jgi:hypothetical protein
MITKKRIQDLKNFGYKMDVFDNGQCCATLMEVAITEKDRFFFYNNLWDSEEQAWAEIDAWHRNRFGKLI